MNTPERKPPDEAWEDPYPKTRRSGSWVAGALLLLLLYVLSIGPACRLAQNQTVSWEYVHLVYTPLNLVAKFPPADNLLQWYIRDVWQVKAQHVKPSTR